MKQKIFLDANVIANWILIKTASKSNLNIKDDKLLRDRLKGISYSHTLVEAIKELKEYKTLVSPLVIGEIYHVIYNEILALKMYRLGIPLTLWSKLRSKHKLKEEEKFAIWETITTSLKELGDVIIMVKDEVNEEVYPKLLLDYNLRPHGAVL